MSEPATESATIFVNELRLPARVGVNPAERGSEQSIIVDLEVAVEDMGPAARSERLRDTMDYVALARSARQVVARRHYPLVETLATEIARALLCRAGATRVRVRVRKPSALRHASAAGVEIELTQDAPGIWPLPLGIDQLSGEEEIVIVGGGAAGLAAALWCWRLGHPALLIDAGPELGGQLHLVHSVMPDLPGMNPLTGRQLAARLCRQFAQHGGRWLPARLLRVAVDPGGGCRLEVQCSAASADAAEPQDQDAATARPRSRPRSSEIHAGALVLCLGARRRSLGVPGERRLAGCGIMATAARDFGDLRGRRVVVIGGADAACENAQILARAGAQVTLVHRGPRLRARASLRRVAEQHPRITVLLNRRVAGFSGAERLEAVELKGPDGSLETLEAQAALVRIGWEPCSDPLPREWLREDGSLPVDSVGRVTRAPGVFAAGDLVGPLVPAVCTAFGSAATAARAAVGAIEESLAALG